MGWLAILLLAADTLLVGLVATQALRLPAVAALSLHIALLAAAVASSRRRPTPHTAPTRTAAETEVPAVAPPPRRERPARPAPSAGRHILLVEDEADLRALVQRILEEEGYEVSCAAHAADAREALEHGRLPDALVTDLSMPGDDGVLLAGEFRRRWPQLPVLFTSGYPDRLERIDRQGMERVSTLAKPFPPDQLVSKLEALIAPGQGRARG